MISLFISFLLLCSPALASDLSSASQRVLKMLKANGDHLPAAELPGDGEDSRVSYVRLDRADPWALGVLRVIRVHRPLPAFLVVVEDVPGYVGLFRDLLEARSTPGGGAGESVVYTETRIALPFVANDRTSVRYLATKTPNHRLASASLVESNHLQALEGASYLFSPDGKESIYWQLNFVHVGFGAARAIPARMFWVENALGGLQADLAMKIHAEQPNLAKGEVLRGSLEAARARKASLQDAFDKPVSLNDLIARLGTTGAMR